MGINILYAGDSPVGGAANYLLGILKHMKTAVTHLPPSEKLSPAGLKKKFDLIIFSDYSKKQVSAACEALVQEQVQDGTGFLMIGGWGSYSGPFGGWAGSQIEKILPVICKSSDDRTNFPGGASIVLKDANGFLNPKIFSPAPAICGLNDVTPKSSSRTLAAVRRVISDGKSIYFEEKEYPLLVIDSNPQKRSAALATDLAPHWCGGMVDWGVKTLKLPVNAQIQVQVGNYYVEFVSSLLFWLARA